MAQNDEEIKPQKVDQTAPRPDVEPIFEKFREVIKELGLKDAVFIFTVEGNEEPVAFWGDDTHFYEAARLTAELARRLKSRVAQELDC
jgi:hypothetical protein